MATSQMASGPLRATKIDFLILALYVSTYFVRGSNSCNGDEALPPRSFLATIPKPAGLGVAGSWCGGLPGCLHQGTTLRTDVPRLTSMECHTVSHKDKDSLPEALEMRHEAVQQCGLASCGPCKFIPLAPLDAQRSWKCLLLRRSKTGLQQRSLA